MKQKDRARDKAERLAARRAETRETKGPQIAWEEAGGVGSLASEPEPPSSPTEKPPETVTPDRKPVP